MNCFFVRRLSSSGDSASRISTSSGGIGSSQRPPLQKHNSGSWLSGASSGGGGGRGGNVPKYLWIRLALFERILAGIIEHIVENHT